MEKNKNTSKKLAEKLYTIATTQYVENTGRGDAIRRMANIIDLHIRNQQEESSQEQTLLPFDLGLVKQGARVVTRDGGDVEIVADDLSGEYPLLAIITCNDGYKTFGGFTPDGEYILNRQSSHDLSILKEPETVRFDVYVRDDGEIFANIVGAYQVAGLTTCPDNLKLVKTINVTI